MARKLSQIRIRQKVIKFPEWAIYRKGMGVFLVKGLNSIAQSIPRKDIGMFLDILTLYKSLCFLMGIIFIMNKHLPTEG